MTDDDILIRLREILVENFEIAPEAVTLEAHLYEELGLDSIDAVDLAIKVQQLTGKRIKPEDFKHVRTVGDVVTTARQLLAA
ncbi:MAG: acyl carrier protein [Pseudomonadota bacterium]|nr:acyl carrier protein [Pseudomonadota bacterium]MDP1903239.1 acyl carrier protein [Pseudomonadota bacterium]MDP2352748.1 acyl carrier protein [Pseudomonadota bacterium]